MGKKIDTINLEERLEANNHNSFLVLITGLSAAGKTTLAYALERKLFQDNVKSYVLDGDIMRKGINRDLAFDPKSRAENNRRVAEIAKLFIDSGTVVLAALIAPYEKDRECIRNIVGSERYVEVFLNISLEECEKRDPKGLYKNARLGKITNMTGISAPYETPRDPMVEIIEGLSVEASVAFVYKAIKRHLELPA